MTTSFSFKGLSVGSMPLKKPSYTINQLKSKLNDNFIFAGTKLPNLDLDLKETLLAFLRLYMDCTYDSDFSS